jgi:SAM-dependent methyltransferase
MWDARYNIKDFVYGKEPNDYLRSVADKIPLGRCLCLGEGEGRNAVYLASLGHDVVAVVASSVGLKKARKLARERKVKIETILADLADYQIKQDSFNSIISIFCHLPSTLRKRLHASCVSGLKTDGVLVLEAYTPKQLHFGTGGPKDKDLLMSLDALREELQGLDFEHAVEIERKVREGFFHGGPGHVVQLFAVKPSVG